MRPASQADHCHPPPSSEPGDAQQLSSFLVQLQDIHGEQGGDGIAVEYLSLLHVHSHPSPHLLYTWPGHSLKTHIVTQFPNSPEYSSAHNIDKSILIITNPPSSNRFKVASNRNPSSSEIKPHTIFATKQSKKR